MSPRERYAVSEPFVEGIPVLDRIVSLIEVYGYETIRELRSSQRDHEDCGGCGKGTQGIVSVWACGEKAEEKRRKSGVNRVLVPRKKLEI